MNMFFYIMKNWKLTVHLLFRTYRFGVNNKWWNEFDSMFGLPWNQRWYVIREYRMMRFRVCECYFVQEPWKLFPWYWRKKHNKSVHDAQKDQERRNSILERSIKNEKANATSVPVVSTSQLSSLNRR